ncbi:transcriptional regulator [Paraburkholderia sp.]|uniref:transcriptional regulator n=1 Tax=Paraburkholderia sp. TaxID=1926495 RepID=UPI00345D39C5
MSEPTNPTTTGIDDAISRAGSQKALAALIGSTQQMVSYWKRSGVVTDASMCAAIESATGVACERLNPNENWASLRSVLCVPNREGLDASDDVQPPVGGINKGSKLAAVARAS